MTEIPSTDLTAEARIRRAALELFGQQGFDGTSTRAVAARAGVTQGLVVHHFGTKEGLRARVEDDVLRTVEMLFTRVGSPRNGELDFGQWMAQLEELYLEHPSTIAYLRRSVLEGSSSTDTLFDRVIAFCAEELA